MPLMFASIGEEKKVTKVSGAADVRQHLVDLGFNVGSPVTVIQRISSGLIVKVKDSRIAIDKAMAVKIQV